GYEERRFSLPLNREDAPMKRCALLTATLVVLGTIALTTTLAQAQTTSNGPYYATPSWDQKLQCDTLPTCPRFIMLSNWNNEAVRGRESGLVWEKSPAPDHTSFSNADVTLTAAWHCNRQNLGSRKGWRLPTIQELASLIDATVPSPGPTLPAGHPFTNVPSSA